MAISKKNSSAHYKDRDGINHHSKELENIEKLSLMCENAIKSENITNYLKGELLNSQGLGKTNPNHNLCEGCDSEKRTEKRICRCMYYYNASDKTKYCNNCKLKVRWRNVGKIKIEDYEVPMQSVVDSVGGIDLVINYNGEKYGVEVKPPNSTETISRMVAETLTYTSTYDSDLSLKPAIAVFKENDDGRETYQYKTIKMLDERYHNEWEKITKLVNVFTISVSEHGGIADFKIEPFCE